MGKSMEKEKANINTLDQQNTSKEKKKETPRSRGRSYSSGRQSRGNKLCDVVTDATDSNLSSASVQATRDSTSKIRGSIDDPSNHINRLDEEVEEESLMDKYIRQQKEAYEREAKL